MNQRELSQAVRMLRTMRGWKQADLARVAGVDQTAISLIERNGREIGKGISDGIIDRVAAALGVSTRTLSAEGKRISRLVRNMEKRSRSFESKAVRP